MVASGVVNGAAAARAKALCAFSTARHVAMHALMGIHRIKARNKLVVICNFSAEKLEPSNGKSHRPPTASNTLTASMAPRTRARPVRANRRAAASPWLDRTRMNAGTKLAPKDPATISVKKAGSRNAITKASSWSPAPK